MTTQQIVIVAVVAVVVIAATLAVRAIRRRNRQMHYKFTLQEHDGSWVYVLSFAKETPTAIAEVVAYSDNAVSAEDLHGIRHHVYFKDGKIVSIHLHEPRRILPHLDPDRAESLRMPAMHAIMFGDPPVPTLLLQFTDEPPDNRTAYAISPNVYLTFQEGALAQVYVTNASVMIPGAD